MKKAESGGLRWHPGITMHKMPVAGVGGLIFAIGIVVIALLGLPIGSCGFGSDLSWFSENISKVAPAN